MSYVPLTTAQLYPQLEEARSISKIIFAKRKDNKSARTKLAVYNIAGMSDYPVDEDLSQFRFIQHAEEDFSMDEPAYILYELYDPSFCTGEDDDQFNGIPYVASVGSYQQFFEEHDVVIWEEFK